MVKEALSIQGKNKHVLVDEEGHAFLLKPNGSRRHLGKYENIKHSGNEESIIFVRSFINPEHGAVRRFISLICNNAPAYHFEASFQPPIQTFRLKGPVVSHMIPAKAA
jgi:hypothetical protein